ncbi:shikimate kinase [Flavobacterium sp.]|jgi:shikimate kinase|uniref:shikimate kinase n=1 Tax=Flavobacterium sp. TaxID=239 RepID=UPI0022C2EA9F|nr:shikimate kinase [Flavobacterium sp.]MCZ8145760.1 AAA family ATPase [Flavobacterium sp.]MCZ8367400.1 AAA family ATPase [Flavobacterium sp.]
MFKVVLTGYMGSGKSTIGALLAQQLGCTFVELDGEIEAVAGISIPTLFADKGELAFRKLEHQSFEQWMQSPTSFVMSTGGGTPCYYNHHEWLQREHVYSVYLKGSVTTLARRLQSQTAQRPLIQNLIEAELEEYIAKHLFDRSYYYLQSRLTTPIDGKTPEEIVMEIRRWLTQEGI